VIVKLLLFSPSTSLERRNSLLVGHWNSARGSKLNRWSTLGQILLNRNGACCLCNVTCYRCHKYQKKNCPTHFCSSAMGVHKHKIDSSSASDEESSSSDSSSSDSELSAKPAPSTTKRIPSQSKTIAAKPIPLKERPKSTTSSENDSASSGEEQKTVLAKASKKVTSSLTSAESGSDQDSDEQSTSSEAEEGSSNGDDNGKIASPQECAYVASSFGDQLFYDMI